MKRNRHCIPVVVVVLTVLAGCTRGEKSPADSPKGRVARTTMPGALNKPLDSYSGDEFFAFVQSLAYSGGHERDRRCTGNPACDGSSPTRFTRVTVDAVTTQDSIGPRNMPKFGVVYSRAINTGDATEARYGMPAGRSLQFYLIIFNDASGVPQWSVEQLDTTLNARRHVRIASGRLVGCKHKWSPGASADFKTCATARTALTDSVLHLAMVLQGGDYPWWVACADGCCEAS